MECFKKMSSIFHSLSFLNRYGKIYLSRQLKEIDAKKCHPPFLLLINSKPGISQESIVNHTKFNKGAIAKIVKQMEEYKYIRREQDTSDKRKYNLYITDLGEEIIPKLFILEKKYEATLTKGMSVEEIKQLNTLLEKAAENLLNAKEEGDNNDNHHTHTHKHNHTHKSEREWR